MIVCKVQNDVLIYSFSLIALLSLIVLPMIFNCKIIPDMEKKIGEKLKFQALVGFYFLVPRFWQRLGWWCEISLYISYAYFWKIPERMESLALAKVNFDIKKASYFEIIMSFFGACVVIAIVLFMICGLLMVVFYPQCWN
jgi:hypothetical protein